MTYDPTGYMNANGQYGLPLASQRQQNLVSDRSVFLRSDGSFDRFETGTQHPTLPVPPPSGIVVVGNKVGISVQETRNRALVYVCAYRYHRGY